MLTFYNFRSKNILPIQRPLLPLLRQPLVVAEEVLLLQQRKPLPRKRSPQRTVTMTWCVSFTRFVFLYLLTWFVLKGLGLFD
jgi:hypothetical protein